MRTLRRSLPLALVIVGCSASSGAPIGDSDTPDTDPGTATATATAPPDRPLFSLLPASPDHEAAIGTPGDGVVEGPDGPVTLGYMPAPVLIPQEAVLFDTVQSLPPAFDLRSQSKLSAVRDQGGCGSCWAFATYSSSESSLLPADAWDFSEDHLNNAHGFDIPACQGGNSLMAMAYLSRWSGPASEADAPYTGKVKTYAKAPTPRKHLTEAYVLPNRNGQLDNDAIKSAVSAYGAVYTTMNWDNAKYKAANAAYYHGGPLTRANHAVAIVGWNDDFAGSSFPTSAPGNGAFLARNSWGRGFGDGGYFWISYYDLFVGKENVVFQGFEPPTNYDGVYQTDVYGQTSALTVASRTTYAANTFTAKDALGLQAVSFYTAAPSTTVAISIYDAPTASPTTGSLIGTKTESEAFAGYHTVSVASLGYALTKGRKFSVVVKVTGTQSQSYIPLEVPFAGYSSKVSALVGTGFTATDGVSWTDTARSWRANVPIKAFVSARPDCDDKNACTVDSWDGAQCLHTPAAKGAVCRAAAGTCDTAEVCDGTDAPCPPDAFVSAGTTCRVAAGVCDVAEVCTGKAAACPVDVFKPKVASCRAATGPCDSAEFCSGTAAACPADVKQRRGTSCRPANGACDAAETCDGVASTCPADKAAPRGTVCRAKTNLCDVAETCDGAATTCPADGFAPSGTVCRAAAGVCDTAESCTGASAACPADKFVDAGTVCRAAAGECDAAEVCSGRAGACPSDALRPKGYVCNGSPVKTCTGKLKTCK